MQLRKSFQTNFNNAGLSTIFKENLSGRTIVRISKDRWNQVLSVRIAQNLPVNRASS
jgi:hypothetical protein